MNTLPENQAQVDGIISTFALTFIPDCGRVIQNGYRALAPGRRWVVLDMAWPYWMADVGATPAFLLTLIVLWHHSGRRPTASVAGGLENDGAVPCRCCVQAVLDGLLYLASGKQPLHERCPLLPATYHCLPIYRDSLQD